ncbi:hypothetical protein [Brevundimonas sp. Root1423]|uniref:hypothetical protein n=1 Tax=Brevundimonas sp. Root1423 TaxID=1736462 RepID=UPI0012E39D96|nr:hypothetical protein [Brevundimonas sp. Root1423]
MNHLVAVTLALSTVAIAACDPIDTSALKDLEDAAAKAHSTASELNARSAEVQQAIDDPVGAMRGAIGATFTRTATDQAGVYVLTDLQTGCQFLGTYAADGRTVSSIAPRVEPSPEGGTRQRCIAIPGIEQPAAEEG